MANQSNIFSAYENYLKNFAYAFTYFPTTNWQRAFSPTINFGCNVEDADVEQHVVNEVGSYGKQINCVLDAMTVLVSRMPRKEELTPQERRYVDAFEDLARAADTAAKKFQDQHRGDITLHDIDRTIEDLRSLAGTNPGSYRCLVERLQAYLNSANSPLPAEKSLPPPRRSR